MADEQHQQSEIEVALSRWRQGDFTLIDCGFLAAIEADEVDAFEPGVADSERGVVGLAVVSQTCDVVRMQNDRGFVIMCPLVQRDEAVSKQVESGRRPNLFKIDGTAEHVFADISRMMSVKKEVLARWPRSDGFSSDEDRARFGAALERKFGRFAFPDEFEDAVKKFKERVWKRHDKTGSEEGKVYRSLEEIRFAADPGWNRRFTSITLLAILQSEGAKREVDRAVIKKELEAQIAKIQLPDGMTWADPPFLLATLDDLTAREYVLSQRADFDFLCN